MAKVIDITLKLIDKCTSPLKGIQGKLKENANQWTRAGKQIQRAGKNIEKVGASLTKTLTVPIATAGAACIKVASDFEAGMSTVQSICGASGEDLDKLSEKAKEMGAKTKFSATEATDAFKYMGMAGWNTQQMLDGIEGVMYLAGATGEDLASTSDIVTDAITAFGLSAQDTNMFVDVLAKTANSANTDVAKLGESFKYVAPIAGAMHYNVQDVSTALGIMANSGIKASTAGTSLRSWISRMAAPTKQVKTALDELGLSLVDANGDTKDFETLMRDTRGAFSELTDAEKAQYASMLAGKSGMSGLLAIVNASESDFDSLSQAIYASDGACKQMYDTANDNLSGQMTILKSTLESIAISLGERMTPYVKKATEWLQKMAEKFNSLSDEQKDQVIKIAGIVAAIGPALLIFGKVVGTVGKVVSVFGQVGKAIKTAGSIFKLIASPAGIAIIVVTAIAVAAFLIIKNWSKVKVFLANVKDWFSNAFEKAKNVVENFKTGFSNIADAVSRTIQRIPENISSFVESAKNVLEKFKTMFQNIFESARQTLTRFKSSAKNIVDKIVQTILEIAQSLQPAFQLATSIVEPIITNFMTTIQNVIQNIRGIIGGLIDFITGVFTGNWKKAWEGVRDIFQNVFSAYANMAKMPLNAVIGVINSAINKINGIHVNIPKWVPGFGGKSYSPSIPTIPTLAKGTQNWKGGLVQISEKGGEIVDLPKGSRVYPHDESVQKAYKDGVRSGKGTTQVNISIPKLADQIIVREDADIERIAEMLAYKLEKVSQNLGGGEIGYIY